VADNIIIYDCAFDHPTLRGTVADNVLTLDYNTSGMDDADALQIFYDDGQGVSTAEAVYALRLDEYSGTLTYVGEAVVGSVDDGYAWRIKQLDSTSGLVVTWAEGDSNFDKQWTERLEYNYS
jgi:hypothetical protein